MSTLTRMAIVIILLALAALGANYMNTAHAAPVSLHGYYARGGYAGNVPGNVEKLARRSGVARLEPVGSGC
jgi:hypothetical protein